MKAIIPVAGAGTKLRPHTYTQPKALIPLAGKTILSIIVDQLHEAGIKDFIFIVGYMGEKIKDYVEAHFSHLNCSFVTQAERKGTGPAIALTEDLVANDEVVVVLGDTIAEYDLTEIINAPFSMLGIKKVDDPRDFGVAEMGEDDFISRVVEKPSIPKSNMALVGVYKIRETAKLFECLKKRMASDISAETEFSLTEAIECMIADGVRFKSFKVTNWFDCGRKESLLLSNSILLKKFGGGVQDPDACQNSIIIPPVSIGAGCKIKNSVIGPNVAIGDHCDISQTIISDSIIGSYARLLEIVLKESLIGSDTEVKGVTQNLNIGDNTAIDLGG
jgi:glucose-1-phosphate thymidylyltransferase